MGFSYEYTYSRSLLLLLLHSLKMRVASNAPELATAVSIGQPLCALRFSLLFLHIHSHPLSPSPPKHKFCILMFLESNARAREQSPSKNNNNGEIMKILWGLENIFDNWNGTGENISVISPVPRPHTFWQRVIHEGMIYCCRKGGTEKNFHSNISCGRLSGLLWPPMEMLSTAVHYF